MNPAVPRRLLPAALALACASAGAQSLTDLHRAALDRDPAVAGAQAQLRAAEQRLVQAQGGLGPNANLTANSTHTRYREGPDFDMRPFRSKQLQLQITQPVLAVARVAAVEAAEAQLDQAKAAVRQAEGESSQRLLEAAFSLLQARDALLLARAQGVEAAAHLQTARRSFQIGTVAVTDVRDAEAKADAIAAQRVVAETDLELRQQVLEEVAGTRAPALQRRGLAGDRLPSVPPASLLEWLAAAQDGSAALSQARHAQAAAEAELRRAWQGHAPTADVSYTYTRSSDTGTVTSFFPRRGDSSAVAFNVTIPLFASGATQARVKEALALREKADADVETARRNVVLGVRQQFSAALSAIGQVRGLETSVRSQELAMRANRRAYEVGMKVNAEVLESQSRWFEARRDLARARYEAWLAWARLQGLASTLDERVVAELDSLLVEQTGEPEARPAESRRSGGARP